MAEPTESNPVNEEETEVSSVLVQHFEPGTRIALASPDGSLLEYEDVTDFNTNGMEVEFKLANGARIVSNWKYLIQEVPE